MTIRIRLQFSLSRFVKRFKVISRHHKVCLKSLLMMFCISIYFRCYEITRANELLPLRDIINYIHSVSLSDTQEMGFRNYISKKLKIKCFCIVYCTLVFGVITIANVFSQSLTYKMHHLFVLYDFPTMFLMKIFIFTINSLKGSNNF
jgi:hypothetical protein